MDLLLDRQQVDHSLVDHAVGPVAFFVEQAAERIFHRAGDDGEDMRFHRGQLDDILVEEVFGQQDAVREDVIQHQHRRLGRIAHPTHLRLVQVDVTKAVCVDDSLMLVVLLPDIGVDDHRLIVRRRQVGVAVGLELAHDALDLPGRAGTCGIPGLPGDVDLENGLMVFRQRLR